MTRTRMDMEEAFLRAVHENPHDEAPWLILADWLEERGDPRGELLRLQRFLRRAEITPERQQGGERLRELLATGVRPYVAERTNSIGMKLALIEPGVFVMGSPLDEAERVEGEHQHEVEITQPFYAGVYPVTQEQYYRVMDQNPSGFASTDLFKDRVQGMDTRQFPVESVLWEEAVEFCRRLSALPQEKENERTYRLPTEAEWEYSCRGGPFIKNPSPPFYFGNSLSPTQANFNGNYPYGGSARGQYLERPTTVGC